MNFSTRAGKRICMSEKPKTVRKKVKTKPEPGPKAVAAPRTRAKTRVMADPTLARRHDRLPKEDAKVEVLIDSMLRARDHDFAGFVFHRDFAGFDGVRFDGHVDFSRCEFLGDADFRRASFLGGVSFDAAEFDGEANFAGVQAWGLQLTGIQAYRGLDLGGSKITGADLTGCRVEGRLSLGGVQINSGADLRRIQVGELVFTGAKVDRVDLREAEVRHHADFSRCQVTDHIDLSHALLGSLDFCEASASGAVGLAAACVRGRCEFRWARIDRGVDARRARFDDVDFHGARVGVLDFREAVVIGDAHFDQIRVTDHAVFREARFRGAVQFDNAQVGGAIDLHKTQFLGDVDFHGAAIPPVGDFQSVAVGKGRGESLCRFARLVLQSMGLHRQGADWRFAECEHAWHSRRRSRVIGGFRRLRKHRLSRGPALAFAGFCAMLAGLPEQLFGRWIFGYGERPLRVLVASAVLILICWPLYVLTAGSADVWESLRHSISVFSTFGNTAWQPAPGSAAAWLQTIQGLASPLLMILFIVTLTRRWSRG